MIGTAAAATRDFEFDLVATIARKELRDALRARWFWLYSLGFAVLAALLAMVALPQDIAGSSGFGRTAASLVALVQLVLPLIGLTLGAQSIAGQAERGTLRFLMSHPVTRSEAFVGTYLGLVAALVAMCGVGFGTAGVVAAVRNAGIDAAAFSRIALLSWVLAAAMLGVGMLISTMARRSGAALGSAVFAWLALVFFGELGIMGTAVATQMPVNVLFFSAVFNPVEAFRLASLSALSGSLDVLGPAGTYAVDTYGESLEWLLIGVLLAWVIAPAAVAWLRFVKGRDL
ncbi:MAG: ABC transporter permease [Acidimicrobiia bacterium]|nr:ABC transporter permease [Acidimicrobiia bacterium]